MISEMIHSPRMTANEKIGLRMKLLRTKNRVALKTVASRLHMCLSQASELERGKEHRPWNDDLIARYKQACTN